MKKLLSLGDSIAFDYRPKLIEYLGTEYSVSTKDGEEEAAKNLNYPVGTNCGDSRMMLAYIKDENEHGRLNYDIIAFNCGLHDIKYNWEKEAPQIEIDEYEENLKKICDIMNSTGAKVYFVNTTPVYDEIHNPNIVPNVSLVRHGADVIKYNAVADKVMKEKGIPVIDLHSLSVGMGKEAQRDHVHYHPEAEAKQAKFIADYITANN